MSVFKRWQRPATRFAKEHFVVSHFDAYQDGALAETETAVYEQHLKTCGACREWVQRQKNFATQLEMEMAPVAVLAPAAAARIQQNLYHSMRRAVIMNNVRTSVAAVGALAVLALVVGAVAWWQSSGFGTGVEAPTFGQGTALTLENPSELDSRVIEAIGVEDVGALAAALEEGANANAESSPGRPALYLAAKRGNADAARLLIDAGADVHADTVDGAILVTAADEGHLEIVEMLLDAGADINAQGRSWTPDDSALYAASDHGHADIARLLVERGADVNQLNSLGETALMAAASRAHPEIVALLLENDAQTDIQNTQPSRGYGNPEWPAGATALHTAAYGGYGTPENSLEVVRLLIDYGAALNIEDTEGRTPLDVAEPQIAELLREAGAQEGAGQSALNAQVISAIGEGDVSALETALNEGADPKSESSPGRPALYLAARRGNAEAVSLLIDAGADVHADTVDGAILVTAADEGHLEVVKILLDAGADINATGRSWAEDDTALYAAVLWKHPEVARLLVERGADVNQAGSLGEAPLIVAVGRSQPDLVRLLLENGANINQQTDEGRTALHFAAFTPNNGTSHPESARVLIEYGAALDIKDNEGRTPLDIALPDVAEILRAAGAEN